MLLQWKVKRREREGMMVEAIACRYEEGDGNLLHLGIAGSLVNWR